MTLADAAIRLIRLTARLECPVCQHTIPGAIPRSGEVWYQCPVRACRQTWLAKALPAGTTGTHLAGILSPPIAAALIRRDVPAALELEDEHLWPLVITGKDAPVVLAIRARQRDQRRLAYAPLDVLLNAVKIAS